MRGHVKPGKELSLYQDGHEHISPSNIVIEVQAYTYSLREFITKSKTAAPASNLCCYQFDFMMHHL